MSGLSYHVRDCAPNTNVMQHAGLITLVKTIAERTKWLREKRGLSQKDLAVRAGVSQGTVGNIESGTRKKPRELLAIAAALSTPPEWLADGRGAWDAADADQVLLSDAVMQAWNEAESGFASSISAVVMLLAGQLAKIDPARRRTIGRLLQDLAAEPEDSISIGHQIEAIATISPVELPKSSSHSITKRLTDRLPQHLGPPLQEEFENAERDKSKRAGG